MYATVRCGWSSSTHMEADIEYYVEVNGVRYKHYLHMYGYRQGAYNTNSDNMWFPMPSNRMLHVEVPLEFTGHCTSVARVIGHR